MIEQGVVSTEQLQQLREQGIAYVEQHNALVDKMGAGETADRSEVIGKLLDYVKESEMRADMVISRENSTIENAKQGRKDSGWFGRLKTALTFSDPYEIEVRNASQKVSTMRHIRKEFLEKVRTELEKNPDGIDISAVVDNLNIVRKHIATLNKVDLSDEHWKIEENAINVTRDVSVAVITLPASFGGSASSAGLAGAARYGAYTGAKMAVLESGARNTDDVQSGQKTTAQAVVGTGLDTARGAATGALFGTAGNRLGAGFTKARSALGRAFNRMRSGPKPRPQAAQPGPRSRPGSEQGQSGSRDNPNAQAGQRQRADAWRTGPRSGARSNAGSNANANTGPGARSRSGQNTGPNENPNAQSGPKPGADQAKANSTEDPNRNAGSRSNAKADKNTAGSKENPDKDLDARMNPNRPPDYFNELPNGKMTVAEYLGLNGSANQQEIEIAARRLLTKTHPDTLGGAVTAASEENAKMASRIFDNAKRGIALPGMQLNNVR